MLTNKAGMEEKRHLRSQIMRSVKSRNTGAEMAVRRLAHSMGYRYRLHRADLPGTPDLAFVSRRKIIFVNGCFWHGHSCKRGARTPKTNRPYWVRKIARNRERDRKCRKALRKAGWAALTIWECKTADQGPLAARLHKFLG